MSHPSLHPDSSIDRPWAETDQYKIWFDSQIDAVHVVVRGFWAMAEAEAYIDILTRITLQERERSGRVKILADRRSSPVFSPELAARFARFNQEIYHPQDRIAFVVESVLLKLQLERVLSHDNSKMFLAYDEAVRWLKTA